MTNLTPRVRAVKSGAGKKCAGNTKGRLGSQNEKELDEYSSVLLIVVARLAAREAELIHDRDI